MYYLPEIKNDFNREHVFPEIIGDKFVIYSETISIIRVLFTSFHLTRVVLKAIK